MNMPRILFASAVALTLSLGATAAFAQSTPGRIQPISSNKIPAEVKSKPPMNPVQKADISKACSAAADKQNLHGKARKKFRGDCKSHGGPVT
jgi:hypothetical protein